MKPFFNSEVYSIPIFKGLITSSGGLTESTVKASSNSLLEYLSENMKAGKESGIAVKKEFLRKMIVLYETHLKVDRVTVPLMKTTEMLLSADYLSDPEIQNVIHDIHRLSVAECSKSKNIVKLLAGVGVFSGILNSPDNELVKKSIKTLLFMLYHNFPKVRQLAAEKLYTGLLTMDEYDELIPGGEEAYDQANDILSETNWSEPVKVLTEATKVQMYGVFGLEPKAPAVKK